MPRPNFVLLHGLIPVPLSRRERDLLVAAGLIERCPYCASPPVPYHVTGTLKAGPRYAERLMPLILYILDSSRRPSAEHVR